MGVAAERGTAKKFHGTKRDVKLERAVTSPYLPTLNFHSQKRFISVTALTQTLLSLVSTTDYSGTDLP